MVDRPQARPGCTWVQGSQEVRVAPTPDSPVWTVQPMLRCSDCNVENHQPVCWECRGWDSGVCRGCGDPVIRPRQRYCSDLCMTEFHKAAKRKVSALTRRCIMCEYPIPLSRPGQARTCNEVCRKKRLAQIAFQNRHREKVRRMAGPPRACEICGGDILPPRSFKARFCSVRCGRIPAIPKNAKRAVK